MSSRKGKLDTAVQLVLPVGVPATSSGQFRIPRFTRLKEICLFDERLSKALSTVITVKKI